MSLRKHLENRMTLDSRTFVECSRRMQCSPTLSRKPEVSSVSDNSTQESSENFKTEEGAKVTIFVTCPTPPPPPPRRKKYDKTQSLENLDADTIHTHSEGHEKGVVLGSAFKSEKTAFLADDGTLKDKEHKMKKERDIFNRPIRFVFDWMTNIANVQFLPPP